jgi:hypothetical protein
MWQHSAHLAATSICQGLYSPFSSYRLLSSRQGHLPILRCFLWDNGFPVEINGALRTAPQLERGKKMLFHQWGGSNPPYSARGTTRLPYGSLTTIWTFSHSPMRPLAHKPSRPHLMIYNSSCNICFVGLGRERLRSSTLQSTVTNTISVETESKLIWLPPVPHIIDFRLVWEHYEVVTLR